MDTDKQVAAALDAAIHTFLTDRLRHDYPYMATAAIERTVSDAVSAVDKGIQAAQEQIEASKSRTNFFSLPAELRNEIYHMVLPPEPWVYVEFREKKRLGRNFKTPVRADFEFPQLLHVSRDVRGEALPILLSKLHITVCAPVYMTADANGQNRFKDHQLPLFKKWLAGLGQDKAKIITSFDLVVEDVNWGLERKLVSPPLTGTKASILQDLGLGEYGLQPQVMSIALRYNDQGYKSSVLYKEDGSTVLPAF